MELDASEDIVSKLLNTTDGHLIERRGRKETEDPHKLTTHNRKWDPYYIVYG